MMLQSGVATVIVAKAVALGAKLLLSPFFFFFAYLLILVGENN